MNEITAVFIEASQALANKAGFLVDFLFSKDSSGPQFLLCCFWWIPWCLRSPLPLGYQNNLGGILRGLTQLVSVGRALQKIIPTFSCQMEVTKSHEIEAVYMMAIRQRIIILISCFSVFAVT